MHFCVQKPKSCAISEKFCVTVRSHLLETLMNASIESKLEKERNWLKKSSTSAMSHDLTAPTVNNYLEARQDQLTTLKQHINRN